MNNLLTQGRRERLSPSFYVRSHWTWDIRYRQKGILTIRIVVGKEDGWMCTVLTATQVEIRGFVRRGVGPGW